MGLDVTILTRLDELESFSPHWDSLHSQSPGASPYLCFDWIVSLLRHRRSGAGLRVAIVNDGADLLAIVPLRLKTRRLGPLKASMLRLIGDGWPPRNGAILHPRATNLPVMQSVLNHLWSQKRDWICCNLDRLPSESPLLSDHNHLNGTCRTSRTLIGRSIVIELPQTWDAYRATLSQAHRKNIPRRTNGLEKKFVVKVVRVGLDTPVDAPLLEKTIADSLAVSRLSWQGSATKGVSISDEGYVDWYVDVCRHLARRSMLDLSVLYIDDRPISFIWGAARWPMTTIAKLAFDPEFAPMSPGLVHLAKHIADSIARKGSLIDFGHEFEDYKRQWGKRADELFDVCYYPPTLRGALVRWLHRRREKRVTSVGAIS